LHGADDFEIFLKFLGGEGGITIVLRDAGRIPSRLHSRRDVFEPGIVGERGWIFGKSGDAQQRKCGALPGAIFLKNREERGGFLRAVRIEQELARGLGVSAPESGPLRG